MKGETYEEFVDKFKPKKTTDDCFTPPEIYEVIRDWACREYDIDPDKIVRPFWPGGDYENYDYPDGCVVLDNPPFSILSKICEFYLERDIPFFLFAPSLTAFSGKKIVMRVNHIICDANIIYENGAVVKTSFVTNYGGDVENVCVSIHLTARGHTKRVYMVAVCSCLIAKRQREQRQREQRPTSGSCQIVSVTL